VDVGLGEQVDPPGPATGRAGRRADRGS
jgi:hypothetical protein